MSETSDILRAAAAIIERDGWWDGRRTADGRHNGHCAWTAMTEAADAIGLSPDRPSDAFASFLGWPGFDRSYACSAEFVFTWNDADGRTADEVTSALRSAADVAEVAA
jgi:hypothetical protein